MTTNPIPRQQQAERLWISQVQLDPARRRPAAVHLLTAVVRRLFWRAFFFVLGGVTVRGRLPKGRCVIVANHCSHADAPALVAALGAGLAPRFAAAQDYWYGRRWRRAVCSVLVGAFPVRRTHDGYTDLQGAAALLAAGHAVVVFPEGTRGDGETIGQFKEGAFRLAAAAGVPVVPVGVRGTARLLPRGGRVSPRPVAVHVGCAMQDPSPERARAAVAELAAAHPRRDSRLRSAVARTAASRLGLAIVAVWAFAEALSWPLLPEVILGFFCVAAFRIGWRLVLTAAAASVAGGLVALTLYSTVNVDLPRPLTTPKMYAEVQRELRAEGPAAVRHQPASGIPYKVYNVEAGRAHISAWDWFLQSTRARGERILIIGGVMTLIGMLAQRVRRLYPVYCAVLTVLFAVALSLVIRLWS